MTVAIPVRDGGRLLGDVLDAVAGQQLDAEVELLVCDSGSSDGSRELARARGAEVLAIEPGEFGHGRTRNLLVERAAGEHVAFLTQDAVPASPRWLDALLGGFGEGEDVALTFGPYVPRRDARLSVRRELEAWFAAFSPDGAPRLDRLGAAERALPARALLGPRAFFTDANGCVAKAAWREVPFRDVPYAEDHQLAVDMLRAGYAKVFVPAAAVVHSHEYGPLEQLRRAFDEWRALHDVYGYREPLGVGALRAQVVGPVRRDLRLARAERRGLAREGAGALGYHVPRYLGMVLGSRAPWLPRGLERRLSLERRGHAGRG